MSDLIERQTIIDWLKYKWNRSADSLFYGIQELPPAQPEYEPVTADDFAKTMSENTIYSFMEWYGVALDFMKRQGFVICKKTI